MPQMGVSVSEGTIVEWRKQPGDWVEYEEPIVDISTDKIDTEVPSPAAGRLEEIVVEVGETVDVGTVLARIATDARPGEAHSSEGTSEAEVALAAPGARRGEATSGDERSEAGGDLQGDTTAEHADAEEAAVGAVGQPRRPGARRYSPVVMRMAAEHHLDLEEIE